MMAPVANGDRRCRHRHARLLANIGFCVMRLDKYRRFILVHQDDKAQSLTGDALYETEERLLRFARRYGFALGPVRPGTEVDRS